MCHKTDFEAVNSFFLAQFLQCNVTKVKNTTFSFPVYTFNAKVPDDIRKKATLSGVLIKEFNGNSPLMN